MQSAAKYLYLCRLRPKDGAGESFLVAGTAPCDSAVSRSLPPGCAVLAGLARAHLRLTLPEGHTFTVLHSELCTGLRNGTVTTVDLPALRRYLKGKGIHPVAPVPGIEGDCYTCKPKAIRDAIESLREGPGAETDKDTGTDKKSVHGEEKHGHNAADALDWNEANALIQFLRRDLRWKDMMLVASGCYLGLRISDILLLRWCDLIGGGKLSITEKKTGKTRTLKVNRQLQELSVEAYEQLDIENPTSLVFESWAKDEGEPISRQRAGQILKEAKERYGIKSAKTFSTHSLRKTFGRHIWQQGCRKGNADETLLLLCEVFGHSSISITKRYLGIRQEEILSVYDNL